MRRHLTDAQKEARDIRRALVLMTLLSFVLPVGLALLGTTIARRIDEAKVAPMTSTADATVTEVIHYTTGVGRRRSDGMRQTLHDVYAYVVRFDDSDGITYEARAINEGETQEHAEGDAVTGRYDPWHPEDCVIVT